MGTRSGHGAARIHDRAQLAVRRLLRWHEQGVDVVRAGAVDLRQAPRSPTYWYLTGVPELMQLVASASAA